MKHEYLGEEKFKLLMVSKEVPRLKLCFCWIGTAGLSEEEL
jgi:hypothetical protein